MKKAAFLVLAVLIFVLMLGGCAINGTEKMAAQGDLKDKRIGVCTGTVYDQFVIDQYPDATIMRFNSASDFIAALKSNKIDAAVSTLSFAKNVIKTNPEIGILADDVLTFPIAVGINKGNTELREKFNAYLKEIKADGTYDAMYEKWFTKDIEDIEMPEYKGNPDGETIILGVSVGDLPSVGYVDGAYVGLDVEMIQSFAKKRKFEP